MSIRKCPRCGLPIGNLETCPMCGAQEGERKPEKEQVRVGAERPFHVSLGVWEILFLVLCNLNMILLVLNVAIGGNYWSVYCVMGTTAAYFLAFACASGSAKRFLTRFRNAVFVLDLAAALLMLGSLAFDGADCRWLYDYFVPCDLIAACLVFLCMTAHKSVSLRSVLLSLVTLFPHALVGLVLALCGVTAHGRVALVLACVAFGCDLVSILDLVVIYLVKYRNAVVETFRLWE